MCVCDTKGERESAQNMCSAIYSPIGFYVIRLFSHMGGGCLPTRPVAREMRNSIPNMRKRYWAPLVAKARKYHMLLLLPSYLHSYEYRIRSNSCFGCGRGTTVVIVIYILSISVLKRFS